MAEAILFPSQPMFMVDRGWQRSRKKKRTKNTLRIAESDAQINGVPEVTITIAKPRSAKSRSQTGVPDAQERNVKVQFRKYEPPLPKTKHVRRSAKQATAGNTMQPLGQTSTSTANTLHKFDLRHPPVLSSGMTGSSSLLYTVIDPEVSDFQRFISYYPTRLASALLPVSKHVRFNSNPIQDIWFPAAMNDEVLLHVILFCSALHQCCMLDYSDFSDSKVLFKVILDRLNRRMQAGRYSDATIGAISCLALCENHLGNHTKWAMHTAGMSEMIQSRGGVAAIPEEMQLKLYRADIIGAVDTLSSPRLPRPIRTTKSLYHAMNLDIPPNVYLTGELTDADLSPNLFDIFIDLSYFCQALNVAAKSQIVIDSRAYEEDAFCIQYDLLTFSGVHLSGVECACRLAALVFMQSIMKETPFTKTSSGIISRELQHSLRSLEVEREPTSLMFWILIMGALVSSRTSEKEWYRCMLIRALESLPDNLANWRNAKARLQGILWIESLHDTHGQQLWHEVFGSF
ncbi:hypothetical protein LTR99_003134 [Exophiala xenobiotica]|uniref:Fungal-specific transcription factor domain-containing protein n=1 Tax=Vermiconidia calcicola TaxID=1690605 RepID=A0AAV9QDA8_9PEZI|nr:hypothetical protein H2202_010266 [Exophiala xenobiotica]KAK5531600.1 hypothetical protein LTR23_009877 [Chaetothyriales sp. CCFEE 6169]KAK5538800.1 hypothetical protein LTR25_004344 [Vermiconidia calcicola]KAK5194631.1 hypothetical protein LTR92_005875 [Exophiala xenobiotica]KAK5212663.1 hypothetical protein LTR41_001609 [Exophiala xenobiotica]